jgi:hypothetical protein
VLNNCGSNLIKMYWTYVCHFSLIFINLFLLALGHNLKAFDDSILFKIDWPGKVEDDLLVSLIKINFFYKYVNAYL